jgi:hypothetical protein
VTIGDPTVPNSKIRALLIAATCTLLAGCFVSERAAWPLPSAERALGDGGRYRTFENNGSNYVPGESITLRWLGDGRYELIDEKSQPSFVSFHPIAGNRFAVQLGAAADKGYAYSILRLEGEEAFIHPIDCEKQDPALLAAHSVERRGRECVINNLTDPRALFAKLTLGEPSSKIVPEVREKK